MAKGTIKFKNCQLQLPILNYVISVLLEQSFQDLEKMLPRPRLWTLFARSYSKPAGKSGATSDASKINADVAGLSSRCVKPTTEPVGPGASATGQYKVPEYFCFDRTTYYEAEVEMAKYRCPQPSALKK